MAQAIPVNDGHSNLENEGNQTTESFIDSASGVVSLPVVIHANAGEVFLPDAMSKTGGLMPILSEAMKEISNNPQPNDGTETCEQPAMGQLQAQEGMQSQYPPYVTVAVNPGQKEAHTEQISPSDHNRTIQTGNENQNNCGYQGLDRPVNGSQECVLPRDTQSSPECEGDLPPLCNPLSGATSGPQSAPVTVTPGSYQKPKMYIAQYIVEAFKRSSKKEMNSTEVYEAVQQSFPYYRNLDRKKKKSWMSSVRHALASSRFKKRRGPEENNKAGFRKGGSLWSLNDDFNPEPSLGRKRKHLRRGSSRRKQKLAGRTRRDFSEMENCNNMPQRMTSVPIYPGAQMSHMQSTFAPAPMVFPSYPMMGYMPPQPPHTAVYQHPMQPQPWLPMGPPPPQLQAGTNQGPPSSKQNMQQMSSAVPGNAGHNMFNQQAPQMQMRGQQMQIPGQHVHMTGQMRPMQAPLYQNMTDGNSDSNTSVLSTAQLPSSSAGKVQQQPDFSSTKGMMPDQASGDANATGLAKTTIPSTSAMASNYQISQAVPMSSTGVYPQTMYASSTGTQAPANTSMNWSYAQPPPSQYYPAVPQQNYNMNMSSTNNTAPELPKSIYPAMCLTTQQLQDSVGGCNNQMTPAPFSTGGPYQAAQQQISHTSHNQYVGSFDQSNVNNGTGIKNEMSL